MSHKIASTDLICWRDVASELKLLDPFYINNANEVGAPRGAVSPSKRHNAQHNRKKRHLSEFCVSLEYLILLAKSLKPFPVFGRTTRDIVTNVIKPFTHSNHVKFFEVIPHEYKFGDREERQWNYVAHAWDDNFQAMVADLQYHFTYRENGESLEDDAEPALDKIFLWLDIFAVNQHMSLEHHLDPSHARDVVRRSNGVILVMGRDFRALKRAWVLFEVFVSLMEGRRSGVAVALPAGAGVAAVPLLVKAVDAIDMETAQVTVAKDKVNIMTHVICTTGSRQLAQQVQEAVMQAAVAGIAAFGKLRSPGTPDASTEKRFHARKKSIRIRSSFVRAPRFETMDCSTPVKPEDIALESAGLKVLLMFEREEYNDALAAAHAVLSRPENDWALFDIDSTDNLKECLNLRLYLACTLESVTRCCMKDSLAELGAALTALATRIRAEQDEKVDTRPFVNSLVDRIIWRLQDGDIARTSTTINDYLSWWGPHRNTTTDRLPPLCTDFKSLSQQILALLPLVRDAGLGKRADFLSNLASQLIIGRNSLSEQAIKTRRASGPCRLDFMGVMSREQAIDRYCSLQTPIVASSPISLAKNTAAHLDLSRWLATKRSDRAWAARRASVSEVEHSGEDSLETSPTGLSSGVSPSWNLPTIKTSLSAGLPETLGTRASLSNLRIDSIIEPSFSLPQAVPYRRGTIM